MTDLTNVINAKDKRSLKKKVWDVDNPYPNDREMIAAFKRGDKTADIVAASGISRQRLFQKLAKYGLTGKARERPDVARRKARDVEILKFIQANPTMLNKDLCKHLDVCNQTLNRVAKANGIDLKQRFAEYQRELYRGDRRVLDCEFLEQELKSKSQATVAQEQNYSVTTVSRAVQRCKKRGSDESR